MEKWIYSIRCPRLERKAKARIKVLCGGLSITHTMNILHLLLDIRYLYIVTLQPKINYLNEEKKLERHLIGTRN